MASYMTKHTHTNMQVAADWRGDSDIDAGTEIFFFVAACSGDDCVMGLLFVILGRDGDIDAGTEISRCTQWT